MKMPANAQKRARHQPFRFFSRLRLVESVPDNDCRMKRCSTLPKGSPPESGEAERIVADAFDAQIAKSKKITR